MTVIITTLNKDESCDQIYSDHHQQNNVVMIIILNVMIVEFSLHV